MLPSNHFRIYFLTKTFSSPLFPTNINKQIHTLIYAIAAINRINKRDAYFEMQLWVFIINKKKKKRSNYTFCDKKQLWVFAKLQLLDQFCTMTNRNVDWNLWRSCTYTHLYLCFPSLCNGVIMKCFKNTFGWLRNMNFHPWKMFMNFFFMKV